MKKKKNSAEPEKKKSSVSSENKTAQAAESADDKIDISKNVFQVNREFNEKRRRETDEQQARLEAELAEREKRKKEAYDRRIREEKIELMRLKQGLIEESETIREEPEEEVKLGFRKKIANFFYHNKWWLGIGIICASICGFLVYNLVTKPRPDIIVLVVANNPKLGEGDELNDYIASFSDDFNNNGKTEVSVYYIPYSDDDYTNYATGSDGKMSTQFQSAESVIVLGSETLDKLIAPNAGDIFVDLESIYPNNPHITGYKFKLKNTDFAKHIGIDPEELTDDLYFAVRTPKKLLYASKSDMEKTYEKDWQVFEKIVNDLS